MKIFKIHHKISSGFGLVKYTIFPQYPLSLLWEAGSYSVRKDLMSITMILKIIFPGGAVITNPPLNQNKTEGDMVSFVCEGEGTPGNLSVAWYRDNIPISSVGSMHGRVNVKTSGNLIISPVKADDAGSYVCELTNGIGRPQTATANLEVTCE